MIDELGASLKQKWSVGNDPKCHRCQSLRRWFAAGIYPSTLKDANCMCGVTIANACPWCNGSGEVVFMWSFGKCMNCGGSGREGGDTE